MLMSPDKCADDHQRPAALLADPVECTTSGSKVGASCRLTTTSYACSQQSLGPAHIASQTIPRDGVWSVCVSESIDSNRRFNPMAPVPARTWAGPGHPKGGQSFQVMLEGRRVVACRALVQASVLVRGRAILLKRERIKRNTIRKESLFQQQRAA